MRNIDGSEVKVAEAITVGDLARQMSLKSGDVIAKLLQMGVMATINQMIDIVCEIAHKWPLRKYIPGPTGGQTRNANNDLAKRVLKWSPKRDFKESLEVTYNWIAKQYDKA